MEAAVTGKHNNLLVRTANLSTKGSAHGITHSTQASGSKESSGHSKLVELSRPKLMLTDIGNNNSVILDRRIDFFNKNLGINIISNLQLLERTGK